MVLLIMLVMLFLIMLQFCGAVIVMTYCPHCLAYKSTLPLALRAYAL